MKDIKGYENLYAVTSCGRVWSYKRKKFLKPKIDRYGYCLVGLYKDGEVKWYLVHRLVALTYIPNPNNLPEVNHKDEVKTHNWISNLEFCTGDYNIHYGTCAERISKAHTGVSRGNKAIYCPELNEKFWGVTEASKKYGLDVGSLSKCINGKRTYCGTHPITGEHLTWQLVS